VFLTLTMAQAEGRNLWNKLYSAVLTVVFMIKIFTSSQVYRLPKFEKFLIYFPIKFNLSFITASQRAWILNFNCSERKTIKNSYRFIDLFRCQQRTSVEF